jgi:hypothetical protein
MGDECVTVGVLCRKGNPSLGETLKFYVSERNST